MHNSEFSLVFSSYRQHINDLIKASIPTFGPQSPLRDACEYALVNGGKRFRPMLVLMMAKALNCQIDVSEAALAIEYLHTASLIADDLPCMDNDAERRGCPSLHKAFDESIALMGSYALIAAGYGGLAKASSILAHSDAAHAPLAGEICRLSLENVTFNTGFFGATGGQFLDLYATHSSEGMIEEVLAKKTVSLFEISFVLGWLFGGGQIDLLPLVKKAAYHFGMAFQIADDIDDMQQDLQHEHNMNIAHLFGKEVASAQCLQHITSCRSLLQQLSMHTAEFDALLLQLADTLQAACTRVST